MLGKVFRGMVVVVSLDPVMGHEQGRTRPWIVVQNDVGNRYGSTTIVVPLTDAAHIKTPSPIYVPIRKGDGGAAKASFALCDQVRTVDQLRFRSALGVLSRETMANVDEALLISLGLPGASFKRPSPQ